jgi:hypothetical protein
MPIISGSLSIYSNTTFIEPLVLPSHKNLVVTNGSHLENRLNGSWITYSDAYSHDILIPARSKELKLLTTNESTVYSLASCLQELDTTSINSRHLHKLHLLMVEIALLEDLKFSYAALVNNVSLNGTISLLSNNVPIYLYLLFDLTEKSIQFLYSTVDIKAEIRDTYGLRYMFYQFPVILNRPIFIHTKTIASHWRRWHKSFSNSNDCMLKCCNATELYLFKDYKLENL